jgi:hypothetical protein
MTEKYSKWLWNIPTFSIPRPSEFYPIWDFWFENKPSGNPETLNGGWANYLNSSTCFCSHSVASCFLFRAFLGKILFSAGTINFRQVFATGRQQFVYILGITSIISPPFYYVTQRSVFNLGPKGEVQPQWANFDSHGWSWSPRVK